MSIVLSSLEATLNLALAQDPETQALLDQFEDRRISLSFKDLQQTVVVSFQQQRLALSYKQDENIDLNISANTLTFISLATNPDNLFSADVTIHGDVQFAKQLQDVMNQFDFDWEAQLAKFTGDTLSYPIAHLIRQTGTWLKQSHQSMQMTTAEYLKEEIRLLPDKAEITPFLQDIDKLRADFDRLEARVNRLQGLIK